MTILVTGGAGYIGSHTTVQLLDAGYDVVILDTLRHSKSSVIARISQISDKEPVFVEGNCGDIQLLDSIFTAHKIDAVIHFAAYKSVGESCDDPFAYYDNNIIGTINLTRAMDKHNVRKIIFSSSATVYDASVALSPYDETMPTGNTLNPYGTTKFVMEQIFRDLSMWKDFQSCMLRYFNPIGAHPSGLIGEDPSMPPTNLLPIIMQVAHGTRDEIQVYGNDYDTLDGTCLRDYIHVMDVADAHVAALRTITQGGLDPYATINIGTGVPTSVQQMIDIVQEVTGKDIPHTHVPRRNGDTPIAYAHVTTAQKLLDWTSKYTVEDGVKDAWRFVCQG